MKALTLWNALQKVEEEVLPIHPRDKWEDKYQRRSLLRAHLKARLAAVLTKYDTISDHYYIDKLVSQGYLQHG